MLQRLAAMIAMHHSLGTQPPTPLPSPDAPARAAVAPAKAIEPTEAPNAEETLRQAQKLETIGRCVGEFAHDFNNLLQVILGNLDRAARTAVPGSKAHACLTDAMMATDRAAGLVGRILAFTRGQSPTASLVDVDALITALRPMIASMTAGCAVDLELGSGGWLCRAEANQLEHAVLNLVLNARDAMPDGGLLTVKTFPVSAGDPATDAGDRVALNVIDTGVGMTPEIMARAFEPFFTTKPAGQGTGLGLAQIAGFMTRAAGTVRIDSAPGQGTCVTLLLPRARPEPAEAPPFGTPVHTPRSAPCSALEPPASTSA